MWRDQDGEMWSGGVLCRCEGAGGRKERVEVRCELKKKDDDKAVK